MLPRFAALPLSLTPIASLHVFQDDIVERIVDEFDDHVQSVDIIAFNKV